MGRNAFLHSCQGLCVIKWFEVGALTLSYSHLKIMWPDSHLIATLKPCLKICHLKELLSAALKTMLKSMPLKGAFKCLV